jgi:hypothetical protein
MITRKLRSLLPLLLALAVAACGDDDGTPVDAGVDAAPQLDASLDAAPQADAEVAPDAASADGGVTVPLPGFGDVSGACGVLDDTIWLSSAPRRFRNALDLDALTWDASALSPGGQRIWETPNLGGSSEHSEVLAYEVLYRCELAEVLATEAEILYDDANGKKTDILLSIDGRRVGVSVVRAYHYPPETTYELDVAFAKLHEKCSDILLSAENAAPENAWERSILAVIAYDDVHADVYEQAYALLDATTLDQTLVMITVTNGTDDYIY